MYILSYRIQWHSNISCFSWAHEDISLHLIHYIMLQHAILSFLSLYVTPSASSSPWLVNRVYHGEHVSFQRNSWFSHTSTYHFNCVAYVWVDGSNLTTTSSKKGYVCYGVSSPGWPKVDISWDMVQLFPHVWVQGEELPISQNTLGKFKKKWWFSTPSGYVKIALENGHRHSEFSHWIWRFSLAMSKYQQPKTTHCPGFGFLWSCILPEDPLVHDHCPNFQIAILGYTLCSEKENTRNL